MFIRVHTLCVCIVASPGPSGVCPGGRVIRHGLLGHGQLGGRMGCHHSGTVAAVILFVIYWDGVNAASELRVLFCAGGVSGAAAVRSILSYLRWVPAASGEGVAVIWPSL